MEVLFQLLKSLVIMVCFFGFIYLPSFILTWWDNRKEEREDLERDIKAQEDWFKSIKK